MAYACRVEADSVSPYGKRLTTMVLTYPRMVHAELMTHRMFSRNASSSRAIPIEKMIQQVVDDPVIPVRWGKNVSGMQAKEDLQGPAAAKAREHWLKARDNAVAEAKELMATGLHKQLVNRLLEPWMWITVIVTATEWDNWFLLRTHSDAEDNLQKIAKMSREAFVASTPKPLRFKEWHLPFFNPEKDTDIPEAQRPAVCTARCARVSYLTHDGKREPEKDLALVEQLRGGSGGIGHWSPFEHVAKPAKNPAHRSGNFLGWTQLREVLDPRFLSTDRDF